MQLLVENLKINDKRIKFLCSKLFHNSNLYNMGGELIIQKYNKGKRESKSLSRTRTKNR